MAVIDKRTSKDGKTAYRVRVRVQGFPIQTATFDRKTDASLWAQKMEAELRLGKHLPQPESKKKTLTALIDRYIEEELPHRNSDHQKYKAMLFYWKQELGRLLLKDLTPAVIAKVRDKLTQEPMKPKTDKKPITVKYRTPQTVKHYLACLSIVLSYCVKDLGWLDNNPMENVRKPSVAGNARLRFLSDEERARLLEACKASQNKMLFPLVVMALSTGARLGELLSLTWTDIDLKKQIVQFTKTKNGEARACPLGAEAAKVLQGLESKRGVISRWVFSLDGHRPKDPRSAWESAVKKAKAEDFKFHDLRHTAASYLAQAGCSLLEIGYILGHKTPQMTKRYAHLCEQTTRGAIDRLDERMFGIR